MKPFGGIVLFFDGLTAEACVAYKRLNLRPRPVQCEKIKYYKLVKLGHLLPFVVVEEVKKCDFLNENHEVW